MVRIILETDSMIFQYFAHIANARVLKKKKDTEGSLNAIISKRHEAKITKKKKKYKNIHFLLNPLQLVQWLALNNIHYVF